MTVTVYRSSDPSAPVLSGVAGTLIDVLTGCLVTGYGAKPAAGWTRPFSTVNKAVFRQPATANQRYLRVDETASMAAGYAGFFAYENMTDVDTGTGQFPIQAQWSGLSMYRSLAGVGNTTPVGWMIIATDKIFHLWVSASGPTTFTACYGLSFGDISSRLVGDQYHTLLMGPVNTYNDTRSGSMQLIRNTNTWTGIIEGTYMTRDYTQTGGSIKVDKYTDTRARGIQGDDFWAGHSANQSVPFPNPTDGKIYVAPMYVYENASGIWRGNIPGVWVPCFDALNNLVQGDQITNVAGLPGKVFEAVNFVSYGIDNRAILLFEISDTW